MKYEEILLGQERDLINSKEPIIIWGAKNLGQMAYKVLTYLKLKPQYFCDMDVALHGTSLKGINIISVKQAISAFPKSTIILSLGLKSNVYKNEEIAISIAKDFGHKGAIITGELIHYIYSTRILTRNISSREYANTLFNLRNSKNILNHLDIVITDKCTLNCRDCGMLIPYRKPGIHADVDTIVKAARKLFDLVDGVRWLQIFGGEPFLHPDICEIIKQIASSPKVEMVGIITNSTLTPKKEQFQEISKYSSICLVSNYGNLSTSLDEVKNECEQNNIIYTITDYSSGGMIWNKRADIKKKNYSDTKKKMMFEKCMNSECICRISPEGLFYFCEYQTIPFIKDLDETKNEIMDLANDSLTHKEQKNKWHELTTLPYITACNYCGIGDKVPAAVQVKGKLDYNRLL